MRRPAVLLLAAAVLALAGCAPTADPAPAASDDVAGTPVPLACEQLVPASALQGAWAGFSPTDDVERTAVSTEIAQYDGRVCGWSDDSGTQLQLAVAHLAPNVIEALKNEYFTTSKAVPTYGRPPEIEGYYQVTDGRGVADAFVGDYWIETSSASFIEPGDPEPLVRSALAALAG
ncbi:hypothetical protein [Rathayibacter iranicus]|uniref:Iron ABC transporter ATP-binding protein n=2 Tax=Rathayibacter iranicus TaxID=59737 RepID=A0AAD1ADZ0_9MICO|nr:hypothetical protein [Rathayibacter iranicus]AZZ55642.1 hypothetical protein C7V51_06895 [Rathayibacter iranicus]MWV31120.1 hypothetical protein [Rathayibacter iranicus NCPPB 2253 = VKM Ac-1602]PPI47912.1 hypothetical protein C5E09_05945 [Rathayibacter iranicus]PPI61063.1 hypothetical protein C5E08_06875 [Rathayibacter iranicus]PPI72960.1 hypothetical protein C5E01_03775 [Rathayibacter iranicus]